MRNAIKLGTKLYGGFLSIALILLLLGLLGYRSVQQLEGSVTLITEEAPLVDAALKMKIAVARDMQVLMEMMASTEGEELAGIWPEHEELVKTFHFLADAMLEGAQTPQGTIYPAKNQALRTIIQDAKRYHEENFRPLIAAAHSKQEEMLQTLTEQKNTRQQLSDTFDATTVDVNLLLQRLQDRMEAKRQTGVTATEMADQETAWVDMARKAQSRLVQSRLTLAKAAVATTEENLDDAAFFLEEDGQALLGFMNILLKGSQTDEGTILAVTDPGLKMAAGQIVDLAQGQYLAQGARFVEHQGNVLKLTAAIHQLDTAADRAGGEMIAMLDGVVQGAQNAMQEAQSQAVATTRASQIQMVTGVTAGLFLALVLGFVITRSITKPVNRIIAGLNSSADQVAAASAQVSSSSQQLAEGSSEQAAAVQETSSSLEEMAATTRLNADHAGQANRMMKEASQVVQQADRSMDALRRSMNDISTASEETQKIVKTIDEIAFQTNLLALNAAVEAARAGEAGAGFAVVADEVRNLALRAADAAKNTAGLIDATVKKVKDGSAMVGQTNDAFRQVAESARKAEDLVGEIANTSGEQARGIEQVSTAVSEMGRVTQQNAANAEESASASEELSAQAEEMRSMVEDLVMLVKGRRQAIDGTALGASEGGSRSAETMDDTINGRGTPEAMPPRTHERFPTDF